MVVVLLLEKVTYYLQVYKRVRERKTREVTSATHPAVRVHIVQVCPEKAPNRVERRDGECMYIFVNYSAQFP